MRKDKKLSLAEQFAEDNGLDVEINQAYIDNIGEEYAKAEDVLEAYQGQFKLEALILKISHGRSIVLTGNMPPET